MAKSNELNTLRKYAKTLGVKVEAERDDMGWGYWLLKDDGSGKGIFEDDNFCTSYDEILYKLSSYKAGD